MSEKFLLNTGDLIAPIEEFVLWQYQEDSTPEDDTRQWKKFIRGRPAVVIKTFYKLCNEKAFFVIMSDRKFWTYLTPYVWELDWERLYIKEENNE